MRQRESNLFARQRIAAGLADSLVLKDGNLLRACAENAGGNVFCEENVIALHEDFNGIVVLNIHLAAHFLGDNDAAKLVDLADNTGCFHRNTSLFVVLFCYSIVANFSTDVNRKIEKITIFVEFFGRKFDKRRQRK